MPCFIIVFLYLLFVHRSEGITSYSVTGCSASAVLSCSNTEMIHVERITFYNITDCNQAVTDLQVCGEPLTGSDTGLVTSCNGKVSCSEILYYSYCPGTRAAKVDYRCITGNEVKDMCDEIIIENTNRIFLSTPNYPLTPTFTGISPCRCSIRGSSITSIQILELALQASNDGNKSSLEINYGDVIYQTDSLNDSTRRVYNKRLSTASTTAGITLNHNNLNRQYLWIEIQGIGIQLRCNTLPTTVAPSTFPPPQDRTSLISTAPTTGINRATSGRQQPEETTSSFTSTDTQPVSPSNCKCSERCDSNKDTTINILAVLFSLCLLIIGITAIIIIVLLRRKKLVWVKKSPQVERERSPYSGLDLDQRVAGPAGTYQELNTRNLRSLRVERERNPYSGLDLNQRVAGNDGTYQELNTRNSTPQYNNVSQNNHRDYYNLN